MPATRPMLAACLGLAACSVPEVIYDPPRVTVAELTAVRDPRLDVLFVIDDSPSMAPPQGVFANTIEVFFDRLRATGSLLDLHVAVTTTDMGTDGTATSPAGALGTACVGAGNAGALVTGSAPVTGAFLSDVAAGGGGRATNYTGALPVAVRQMLAVGEEGCGFEQPLFAMMAALQNASSGFRREGAALAVILLTDEDDCSVRDSRFFTDDTTELGERLSLRCTRVGVRCAQGGATPAEMGSLGEKGECTASPSPDYLEPLDTFSSYLATVQPDPRRLMVAALVGDPSPVSVEMNMFGSLVLAASCSIAFGTSEISAAPAIRIIEFVEGAFEHSTWRSICMANQADTQRELARLAAAAVGGSCVLQPILDIDPGTPGMQADCVLDDTVGTTTSRIPACGAVIARPCWRLELDAQTCPFDDHLALVVERASAADPDSRVRLRCRVP